jgi:hypothetical protein
VIHHVILREISEEEQYRQMKYQQLASKNVSTGPQNFKEIQSSVKILYKN